MDKLKIATASSDYHIYFRNDFNDLERLFTENNLHDRKICIVTDSNVEKLYLKDVMDKLDNIALEIYSFTFQAGEENKNLNTVSKVYEFLVNNHFDRKSIIVALGGGVTGDLAGFIASTYMRGIDFVQVPTTLLAQVDSSVGGKVGVDFLQNKNMVGAFYQPKLVFTNISTLETLASEQFSSGMGEIIKHGLIMDKEYYKFIVDNKEGIKLGDKEILKQLIYGSCKIKANVVSQDEKEHGIRALLNFGHTFGHAVETLSNFKLTHGNAVSIGAICSINYSITKGFITEDDKTEINMLFDYFGLNNYINDYNKDEIIEQMYLDKKTKNNVIEIVYLVKIGKADVVKITDEDELLEYIKL